MISNLTDYFYPYHSVLGLFFISQSESRLGDGVYIVNEDINMTGADAIDAIADRNVSNNTTSTITNCIASDSSEERLLIYPLFLSTNFRTGMIIIINGFFSYILLLLSCRNRPSSENLILQFRSTAVTIFIKIETFIYQCFILNMFIQMSCDIL